MVRPTTRPLGVGCSLAPSRPQLCAAVADLVDFIEVGPDTLCREVHHAGGTRLAFVPELLDDALEATRTTEVVVHGVELSLGTASGWNEAYLEVLDAFAARRPFAWHSEHLGFLFVRRGGEVRHAGVPLPLPFTREAVALVAPRLRAMEARFDVPFLVENAAHYLPDLPADLGWDEATFLTEVVQRGGCGLLLDLHNLWANACNHGFDAMALLDRLPLEAVVEVHVAGGDEADGFVLDSHSSAVAPPVWALLDEVLRRAPGVSGVVFEFLEAHLPRLGVEGVRRELGLVRAAWDRAHAAEAVPA